MLNNMTEYPKKRAAIYTKNFSIKLEPELVKEIKELNGMLEDDIYEVIRMRIRALRDEFRIKATIKAS
jgi:hypothetical protein